MYASVNSVIIVYCTGMLSVQPQHQAIAWTGVGLLLIMDA